MSIFVRKELDFDDIKKESWCCDDVLETIENADKESEFMNLLAEVFEGCELTMTELNYYIRFETADIFKYLGLTKDDKVPTEEEEE